MLCQIHLIRHDSKKRSEICSRTWNQYAIAKYMDITFVVRKPRAYFRGQMARTISFQCAAPKICGQTSNVPQRVPLWIHRLGPIWGPNWRARFHYNMLHLKLVAKTSPKGTLMDSSFGTHLGAELARTISGPKGYPYGFMVWDPFGGRIDANDFITMWCP